VTKFCAEAVHRQRAQEHHDHDDKRTQLPASSPCEALGAGLAMLLLPNLAGCSKRRQRHPPTSPAVVELADVVQQDTPIYSEWIAILDGGT
jgi:hypothetical protein